jgi:pyruvate kinase
MVKSLVDAGMDVARLNFSHGDYSDHEANYNYVRSASDATGRAVGILADLQGPKIRLGRFSTGATLWATGETVRITVEDVMGVHDRVSTTYKNLAVDASPGDRLLVDDGNVGLVVDAIEGDDVVCKVTEGGRVSNNKGLSLPGMNVSVPAMSEKDIADLEFALKLGVDLIALSFVRSPADIEQVHEIMDRVGRRVPVIAKLEKPEAIANLEAIVLAFDAIMVARGDLGVELPLEEVPLVQKRAIQMARENAKPVIVATQMLESMIEHSRPTRAEASDVANAVLDGTDAVMLSAESASGQYPVETIAAMNRICIEAERTQPVNLDSDFLNRVFQRVDQSIALAAIFTAYHLKVKAIASLTESGSTALWMSRLNCGVPIYALTAQTTTRYRCTLFRDVYPLMVKYVGENREELLAEAEAVLVRHGIVKEGDIIVLTIGEPIGKSGGTNTMKIVKVGEHRT